MKAYITPEFHFISNTGGLSVEEIARLSDAELAEYLKKSGFAEAKKRYRINPGYVLRQIGGEYAIIPVEEECAIQNAMMIPNGPAVFLWNAFMAPSTEADVVRLGMDEYEASEEQMRSDVRRFMAEMLEQRILMEVV